MPQLLLELLSEEIPARMQAGAARELEKRVIGALTERGLLFEAARAFHTPRQLTLVIEGLPARQPDVSEERKGPRVNAPQAAIDGFLKSTGLTLDALTVQADPKGDFYLAVIRREGRETPDLLAEILPAAILGLPWPKSMRPGEAGPRWVRPLQSILCTFDGEVVPFAVEGVGSGNLTRGHRFMSDGAPFAVRRYDDYVDGLKARHVILDPAERREIIARDAQARAFALGLEVVEDEALLAEVAGLVEWPVVLTGSFDRAFLDVPAEVLTSTMRANQKYFALRRPGEDGITNRFVVVANIEALDGGAVIVAGNERVLRARLSDARFFWEQDKETPLETLAPKLDGIVFHAKLGTQGERVKRLVALAREIAPKVGADPEKAARAAFLAKADLLTGTVGEFPEVQGLIGGKLASLQGEDADVAAAIRDHYRPLGPADAVPTNPVAVAVALADKLDTLVGFFAIGEKPTGSGDPFALRRAALGVIRILLTNDVRLGIGEPIAKLMSGFWAGVLDTAFLEPAQNTLQSMRELGAVQAANDLAAVFEARYVSMAEAPATKAFFNTTFPAILAFCADRLKVALKEQGVRHDLIDAVFALGNEDDLVRLVARVQALQTFLKTEDGANLVAGYRRAVNILRIEEKKDKRSFDGTADPALLTEDAEKALYTAMATANDLIAAELERERFEDAMRVMAQLRSPVDTFFEKVQVNAPDPAIRENRLKLLSQIRAALHAVADFAKIEG